MKIKVCGMKYPDNISELALLPIDYIGLIFYSKSPRYIDNGGIPDTIQKKVGVFVNSSKDYILAKIGQYNLDILQLHGNESPELCKELNNIRPVIKAFSISDISDFEQTKDYEGSCDYFLFDTKTSYYGGSGKKFDWNILDCYRGNTSFFLSGGISIEDAGTIRELKHPRLYSIDLNSRFETEPGLKDINLLQQFIKALKNEQD
jgi:phosphoribosylanthranilate isomerase